MSKEKKTKEKTKKSFYKLWWFWLIIGTIFAGTWVLFSVGDLNVRTSIIGILGIWGSALATIFIGIIAEKQNEKFEFSSKKQQLLIEINDNHNFIQNELVKLIDTAQVYSLFYSIYNCFNIVNVGQRTIKKLEIMLKANDIIQSLLQSEAVIKHCKFSAQNITNLFNDIKEFEKFIIDNNDLTTKQEYKEDYRYKKTLERFNYISEWHSELLKNISSINVDYQTLSLEILNSTNLDYLNKIEQKIITNQQTLLTELY